MSAGSPGFNAITAAVIWLQGVLLGPVATTIAVIEVASIGFLMLTGRIDFRRSSRVIVGCFVVFGASTIAAGIQAAILEVSSAQSQPLVGTPPAYTPPPPPPPVYPHGKPANDDPYAGAAVPTR